MMSTLPKRAAIYTRLSSDREGRELGVARQEVDCRALVADLGWTLHPTLGTRTPGVFTDNDKGASTLSTSPRPEYEALLAAVRAGEIDGVIYWSNSRLTRRMREYVDVIDLVRDTGVRLAAVKSTQVDLTTASGRMVGQVMAAVDQAEAEQISERVARRQQQRREAGLPHTTGLRCFGFLPDGVTPEPAEADAIRHAARMVIDGASLGDVVRHWTEAGTLPPNADHWCRLTVRRALTRPRVAGIIEHKGIEVGTFTDAPVLDRGTWQAVCAAISDRRSPARARHNRREHVLSGFLTCGRCGHPLEISARRDQDGNVRADSFVACRKDSGDGDRGCGKLKRNLRLLEAHVLAAVEERLAQARPFAADDPTDPDAVERARLVAERETVEAKIAKLRKAHETDPDFDAEDYVLMVKPLRKLARELDELIGKLPEPAGELGEDPLADWRAGDFDQRRDLLAATVKTVVVSPIGKVGPARARAMIESTTRIVWR